MTVDLDRVDRAILNAFQGGFPVVPGPFGPAAAALSEHGIEITGNGLLDRIRTLDREGILTRFGALINAEAIGGTATLVATHAPDEYYDDHAGLINDYPEVAHNYERNHPHLNMWFVLSVAEPDRVETVLSDIEEKTGETTYNLPKQQEFHVGAKFPVEGPQTQAVDCSELGPDATPTERETLTPKELDLVLEIQDGLPITGTPYADVAEAIDADTDWVIETITRFNCAGKIRRVGTIPNHYALGYSENGMTVWDVPDDIVDEVGPAIAEFDFVTHCYERPRHEDVWPYNFFAMTHGRDEEESQRRIEQVRERMADYWDVTDDDWETLFSTRILKKTGIRIDERAKANVTGD
jgi:DNA-binding Lrp family transcriptional regulator